MESSTETLLIILVSVLSALAIIALAVFIALVVAAKKLLKKIELVTDAASETVFLIRKRMIKKAGILVTLKNLPKLFKRK